MSAEGAGPPHDVVTPARGDRRKRRPWRWAALTVVVGVVVTVAGLWLEYGAGQPQVAEPVVDPGSRRTDTATPATTVPVSRKPATTPRPASKPTARPPAVRPTAAARRVTRPPKSGRPVTLSLPRLGVSARVVAIRARGGSLIPPSNPRTVGWWSGGAPPGAAKGSAVITGHTVHSGGGAFDDLDRLRIGDTFVVGTPKGRIGYRVTSVAIYRKQALAKHAAEVFDQGVDGRVVLVTCEDWTGSRYLSNAVVIGRPIG